MNFLIVIILVAALDRLREYTQFGRWFDNSILAKVKNEHLHKWLRSKAVDKWKPFGEYTPPQMYDLYHFSKGLIFLVLIIYHCTIDGWKWFLIDGIIIYIIQSTLEGDDLKKGK